jgi:hypothetical protein
MASTYTLISSNTLGSSAATVTFSSIPSTYTDLVLRISSRLDANSTSLEINFNGNTSSVYRNTYLNSNGTSTESSNSGSTTINFVGSNTSPSTASTFSNVEVYIPNYQVATNKPFSTFGVTENNATTAFIEMNACLFLSTAAITSISLYSGSGSAFIVAGSSFYLYGIKNS